jgi:hypothetical protein
MRPTYRALQCTALSKSFEEGIFLPLLFLPQSPFLIRTGIQNLKVVNLPSEPCGVDQVRIRVHAAAVNYFDLLMFCGRYQHKASECIIISLFFFFRSNGVDDFTDNASLLFRLFLAQRVPVKLLK